MMNIENTIRGYLKTFVIIIFIWYFFVEKLIVRAFIDVIRKRVAIGIGDT